MFPERVFIGAGVASLLAWVTIVAAYVTHLSWTILMLMGDVVPPANKIVLALIGAVVPPFGALHGVLLWFS